MEDTPPEVEEETPEGLVTLMEESLQLESSTFQCSCLESPRDGEPGGLLSMVSHRVGHD